ncbi:MAG TPA: MATE family efflux transporter [Trebonia sp.]
MRASDRDNDATRPTPLMSPPAARRGPIDYAAALGTRPVGQLLWSSCSQTTLSVGVYGIYALTSTWFVAHGVGDTAMAAVNLVAPVLLLLNAVASAVGVGGGSLVSRSLGADDTPRAARAAGNAFTLFWLSAIITTVIGLSMLGPLLTMLGAHGALRGPARSYAIVLLSGAITSTGFSTLVRAEGRMRFSALLWLVPVMAQIALDPVLIFGLHWGVRGAAFGIIAGQAISAGMSGWFFFLQHDRPYRITLADLLPHVRTVGSLLGIGAPSFLTGIGATALAVLVNSVLAHAGSVTALAAYAVCTRIRTFITTPQLGISQGLQPVVGYSYGRAQPERARRAMTLALRATVLYGVLVLAFVSLLAGPMVAIFVTDPGIASAARDALRIIALAFAAYGVTPLVCAYFQSVGKPKPSYLLSLGTLLAVKIPLVITLGRAGPNGLWTGLAAGELASALIALIILKLMDPLPPLMPDNEGHVRTLP